MRHNPDIRFNVTFNIQVNEDSNRISANVDVSGVEYSHVTPGHSVACDMSVTDSSYYYKLLLLQNL